jgi:adenosine deaminase
VFETMPKVELHLHLEGAIPAAAMWDLVQRRGGDPEVPDREALAARYAYRDFGHFIETWIWQTRFLDSYEAFTFAAEAVAASLAAQHVVYAEAFFSPSDFRRHGLTPPELAMAVRAGLDRVPDVEIALIIDLVRDTGPERALQTLESVRDVTASAGIVGVGLGGTEERYPAAEFHAAYRRAAELGLRRTAHAGEADGPGSVWGALRSLGVDRIGHGIRSVEDPALVEHLVASQTPMEVCPTSNLRTAVVADWASHPVRELIDAGAMVTLNTDDPAMFACTLAGEYQAVAALGVAAPALRRLAGHAIDASWAAPAAKTRLRAQLDDWWDQDR